MKIDDSSRVDITITRGDDLCEIARGISGWLNLVFLRFRNTFSRLTRYAVDPT